MVVWNALFEPIYKGQASLDEIFAYPSGCGLNAFDVCAYPEAANDRVRYASLIFGKEGLL